MLDNKNKKKALIFLVSAVLLSFLMIQPFNLFCRATDKCQPIIFSYYLPKSVGSENFEIFFEAKNLSKDIKFQASQRSVIMLTGDVFDVKYRAKNISNEDIKIRPKPYVIPESAAKYIKFYECLCYREHNVEKGSSIVLSSKFRLDREIEKDAEFKDLRAITIGYE